MTRCRCAECGALLAHRWNMSDQCFDVHPCGACLQDARADAVTDVMASLAEQRALEQEGRD